jgi:hypothetical protein
VHAQVPTERLLILASSKKLGARCIAGISLETGQWVRPVSTPHGGALATAHCGVEGRYPRVLEVVRFEKLDSSPLPHQPENVLVPAEPWELEVGMSRIEAADVVDEHLEYGPELLRGTARTLDEQAVQARPMEVSLAVVEPQDLHFEHEQVPWGSGSRMWARFRLGGHHQGLTLSDFAIRPRLGKQPPGIYTLEGLGLQPPARAIITVSLGDALDGRHYKLAAAVFGVG